MIKKIKAIELIMDWNLWPRHEANSDVSSTRLDSTNVKKLKEALKMGAILPPVIADKKSKRIIDGFHRTKAYLTVFGNDVEIDVDLREYETEAEMFADSARLNQIHGMTLTSIDITFGIVKLRKMKVPYPEIAKIYSMDEKVLRSFVEKRTAKSETGEIIPLSKGAQGFAGKVITPQQEAYAKTCNGTTPIMYIRLLANALKSNSLDLNPEEIKLLKELKKLITDVLGGL